MNRCGEVALIVLVQCEEEVIGAVEFELVLVLGQVVGYGDCDPLRTETGYGNGGIAKFAAEELEDYTYFSHFRSFRGRLRQAVCVPTVS